MNNWNWTAGPWYIRQPNGEWNGYSVGPAWLGLKTHTDECKANAHLIAAAPELYSVAMKVMDLCGDPDYFNDVRADELYEMALSACKKARGEQK